MPLKLNVGLSKKIGQPEYGSLGASCYVEVELDQSLIFEDLDRFQERVSNVFDACRQAVTDELARQTSPAAEPTHNGHLSRPVNGTETNGASNGHRASQKQLDYAKQLSGQIRGLGARRLESLASKMFCKPMAGLSSLDASGLIDALKEIKAGKVDLAAVLGGIAAA